MWIKTKAGNVEELKPLWDTEGLDEDAKTEFRKIWDYCKDVGLLTGIYARYGNNYFIIN